MPPASGTSAIRCKPDKSPFDAGAVVRSLSGARTVREGQETVVTVPDDVPPKKVETAPGAAPAEVRHVARAEDIREGTEADDWVLTLLVGVLHAVRKEAFNLRRLPEIFACRRP